MTYRIRLSRRARRELALARAWWRVHRPAAPGAIAEEMRKVRHLLAKNPEVGVKAEDEDLAGLHRVLLARSDYWLYYRVDHAARQIEVVTVWHASRLGTKV